jgi:5-formyltetrahydrofolate cyclo-ligase
MKKASPKSSKEALRLQFHTIRAQIASPRRHDASIQLLNLLYLKGMVASFASFGDEIDLWRLNEELARQGRLLLPKVVGQELHFCPVAQLKDLKLSAWGILEPTAQSYAGMIDAILVPGLAFDRNGHRLGYGKGYYDRFLNTFNGQKIGVGFKEQMTDSLPAEAHDVAVSICSF